MSGTGVWLVGARGNVATTAIVGGLAIARGEERTTGMVTTRHGLPDLALPDVSEFVFAGHDVQEGSLVESARSLASEGAVAPATVDAVEDDLRAVDERIRLGTTKSAGPAVEDLADDSIDRDRSLRAVVDQLREDFASFRREHDLERVVVIDVASTEAALADPERYDSPAAIEGAIDDDDPEFPASALYAYAAITGGHPFVNFTPSAANALGGIRELAEELDVPHMGRDAKTGETLVKSALAPMFAGRNLPVLSWEGHNILGNADGLVLEEESAAAGKMATKGGVLDELLPGDPHNAVRIDYTPSLGDRKTAWDYVHFEGFLGQRMTMQFIWEGVDSALAAPLVLDLARLVAYADDQGEGGLQPHLASFFKDPLGVDEHDLSRQFQLLERYAREHGADLE